MAPARSGFLRTVVISVHGIDQLGLREPGVGYHHEAAQETMAIRRGRARLELASSFARSPYCVAGELRSAVLATDMRNWRPQSLDARTRRLATSLQTSDTGHRL